MSMEGVQVVGPPTWDNFWWPLAKIKIDPTPQNLEDPLTQFSAQEPKKGPWFDMFSIKILKFSCAARTFDVPTSVGTENKQNIFP